MECYKYHEIEYFQTDDGGVSFFCFFFLFFFFVHPEEGI